MKSSQGEKISNSGNSSNVLVQTQKITEWDISINIDPTQKIQISTISLVSNPNKKYYILMNKNNNELICNHVHENFEKLKQHISSSPDVLCPHCKNDKNMNYLKSNEKTNLRIRCKVTGEIGCKCDQKKINGHDTEAYKKVTEATMRKLFTEHAYYTKFVINSIVDETGDIQVLLPILLKNQVDIGNEIKPIVGEDDGNELTRLLTEHIELAGEVIKSAKTAKTAKTSKSSTQKKLKDDVNALFRNSDEVSEFLSSLNPDIINLSDMKKMFKQHNQYVIDMTNKRLERDYKEEQKLLVAYYKQILEMSDHIYYALSSNPK